MQSIKYFIFLCVGLLCLASCKEEKGYQAPPTVEQLFNDYKKSVVLIYNRYYYELKLDNQNTLYFASLDPYGDAQVYTEKDEVLKHASHNMGTGFFISTDGKIATNLHVLQPELSERQIAGFEYLMENFLTEYQTKLSEIQTNLRDIELALIDPANLTAVEIAQLKNEATELRTAYSKLSKLKLQSNYSIENLAFKTAYVGIAYENAQIEPTEEETDEAMYAFRKNFTECNVVKMSKDRRLDLAIIQLKDKKTPDFITKIFNYNDNNPNVSLETDTIKQFDIYNPVEINKDVYMIGYNYGLELAKTAAGIKPQFTKGIVSQESDGIKVMYTIPALPGSSGSPVIDGWGNLVAVNFSGLLNTQSFNYGILSKHLMDLDSGKANSHKMIKEDENFFKRNKNQNVDSSPTAVATAAIAVADDADATSHLYIITQFLSQEDNRDIQAILNYLSDPMEVYWDMKNVSKNAIKTRYENNWKQSKWSKNYIESVTYLQPKTYKAVIIFEFENNKGEVKEVKSTLKFIFDNQDKIKYINKF